MFFVYLLPIRFARHCQEHYQPMVTIHFSITSSSEVLASVCLFEMILEDALHIQNVGVYTQPLHLDTLYTYIMKFEQSSISLYLSTSRDGTADLGNGVNSVMKLTRSIIYQYRGLLSSSLPQNRQEMVCVRRVAIDNINTFPITRLSCFATLITHTVTVVDRSSCPLF